MTMPPTPEDIDAARAQPHPDDVKAAQSAIEQAIFQWSGPMWDHIVPRHLGLLRNSVASAISAARERGAREERERLKCKIMDTIETSIGLMFDEEDQAAIRARGTT